ELGMELEADEAALEPVVDGEREQRADVHIDRRLVVAIEHIEEAARVLDEVDPRPAGGRHVLIGRPEAARIGQTDEIGDLDRQAALLYRRRDRVGDLPALSGNRPSVEGPALSGD